MKKAINHILGLFGLQLVRTNQSKNVSFPITNAINHNSLERTNDFYRNKKLVNEYVHHERSAIFSETLKNTALDLNYKKIIDVGCGTGHFLSFVLKMFPQCEVKGVEYSGEAVLRAKEFFPEITFETFDVYNVVQAIEKFDVVFCMEVLEHLKYPDKALKNLYALLKTNGTLIITVPNGRADTFEGHIHFWSPESWKLFCEGAFGNNVDIKHTSIFEGAFLLSVIGNKVK